METDRIEKVIEDITEKTKKIGLYVVNVNVATSDKDAIESLEVDDIDGETTEEEVDFREKIAKGESYWMIQTELTIGELAFSERVLDPETYQKKFAFDELMPSDIDVARQKFLDSMKDLG